MNCQTCKSENVVEFNAHHSDCFSMIHCTTRKEIMGYAPSIGGICSGDDTFPKICLDCGQVQGTFPKKFDFPKEDA